MGQPRDRHRPDRSGARRWLLPGAALVVVAALAGYVALLNWQVRHGDVQWRYVGDGPVRVLSSGERFLVVDDDPAAVVLDRSDGTKVMELEYRELGFALGDTVMATGETGYRLLSAAGDELWSEQTESGTSVAPVAADVATGRAVLLEQRDGLPDLLRGIDLASGRELWREAIDVYGGNPFEYTDLHQPEQVELLPVQLPGEESLTALSLDGEEVASGVEMDSSPFAFNNGDTLVLDEQGCGTLLLVRATGEDEITWDETAPDECHLAAVGQRYAFLITGPWASSEQARLLAVDLDSGEPTGLDVSGPHDALRAAVESGQLGRGPGSAVIVPDGDESRLYDVRTGEQTWSANRPGRWSYDAGPAGAVLVTTPSGLLRALTPADDDSVRHELMDASGDVAGVVYEIDTNVIYGTNLVLDQGQAAVTFGGALVMLGE